MMWRTHMLCGVASLYVLAPIPGASDSGSIGVLSAIAAFAALLPDLDAAESKAKHLVVGGIKPFLLPSQGLHRTLGHRGALHSPPGLCIFAMLSLPLLFYIPWDMWAALVIGYASHLAADACTLSGIPLNFASRRKIHLLPPVLRVRTGAPEEDIVFILAAVVTFALLLTHLSNY